MEKIDIDTDYLLDILEKLLNIPSPSGYSDQIVHFMGEELDRLGIDYHVTRRGAIRASLPGEQDTVARAVAVHLDTLGAMVRQIKENGRLAIAPIGTWSSRFAEGGRVTIFADGIPHRGTVLPLKSSGHVYGDEIDRQSTDWDHLEIRVDHRSATAADLISDGFDVGDVVAFDAAPEILGNGYINARHLDDKAGVAILLATARALTETGVPLPVTCHLIFTIFEEIGVGGSAVLYENVTEMVAIDHAPLAPGQNSSEFGVTIGMMDAAGPFDYHLSRKLSRLCLDHGIEYVKDVFRLYRTDLASAIEAGNDTRTALACFGVDASHGYERAHIDSLNAAGRLMALYLQSAPTFSRDRKNLSSLNGFPRQPTRKVIKIKT
jgi:peptidase M42 family hydrolase